MKATISENERSHLLRIINGLHHDIRNRARNQMIEAKKKGSEELTMLSFEKMNELHRRLYDDQAGDVMYKIDVAAEQVLDEFAKVWEKNFSFILISEATGARIYPANIREEDAKYRIIVDVIDGTRPLMYDIDSAYILTGVAPNKGKNTSLNDIEIAVQTEIPTTKQYLADTMQALKDEEPKITEWNILTSDINLVRKPTPTKADSISHGFAMFTKYFRGKDIGTTIEEALFRELLGTIKLGEADVFDHQYISSAGQLAHLINGKYRFCADIRPWTERFLAERGDALGLCAHPYDLCTKLIAEQAGIIITDMEGNRLNAPLDTTTNVGWIGYANEHIRKQVEKPLLEMMKATEEQSLKELAQNL